MPHAGSSAVRRREEHGPCRHHLHVMKAEVAFPRPAVLGHEISGVLVGFGPSALSPLSDATDAATACIAGCAGLTSYGAVVRAGHVADVDSVVVVGVGGVGSSIALRAPRRAAEPRSVRDAHVLRGLTRTVSSGSARREPQAGELGRAAATRPNAYSGGRRHTGRSTRSGCLSRRPRRMSALPRSCRR